VAFDLTPDQLDLRTRVREVAHDVLAGVREIALARTGPQERFAATRPAYGRLVEAGCLRQVIPQAAGGDAASLLDVAVVAEELMAVDANVPLTLFATALGLAPVVHRGTRAQQRRLLQRFLTAAGTPLAAFAQTEPGGSANVDAPPPSEGLRTTATPTDRGWVVDGRKKWVSNASGWDGAGADLTTVVCRTGSEGGPGGLSVLAVRGPVRGLTVAAVPETLGHRAHLTPTVVLDEVRVPAANLIGKAGDGLQIVGASFLPSVALVGAFALVLMRSAYEFALHFARTERRGGPVPIVEHQTVGYALVDAKIRIEAVRALTWRACRAIDAQAPEARELALHAKIFGSETAVSVITDLVGVVGVDSYDHDLPLAGLLQDALALPIFGGSNRGVRRRQLHQALL
jgi:nitroalkane oxidase